METSKIPKTTVARYPDFRKVYYQKVSIYMFILNVRL